MDVAREMGVRTNVPFRDLSDAEKTIVYEGPAEKRHIVVATKTGGAELDFTYFNAVATVENALSKAKDEKALARVAKSPARARHATAHAWGSGCARRSSTASIWVRPRA